MKIEKKILVLGNMSSGKSTFINSFLKNSLLPTSNLVCTTQKLKIKINNKLKNLKVNSSPRQKETIKTQEELKKIMLNEKIKNIKITAPSTESKLNHSIIYDSPGINNSIDENHKEITINLFNNNFSTIFLILNAENLCTTDDERLLNELKKYKIGVDKHINIIVNKIDKILLSETDTVDEVLGNLKKFLQKNEIIKYDISIYSSIYFELVKEKSLEKKRLRLLNLLEDFIGKKEFNKMKRLILKKI